MKQVTDIQTFRLLFDTKENRTNNFRITNMTKLGNMVTRLKNVANNK